MEQEPLTQRIKFLVDSLADSVRAFGTAIGEKQTTTSNYVTGRNKPSADFLEKIVVRFRNVNPIWLLTGEGEPFLSDDGNSTTATIDNSKNKGNVQNNTGSHNTINNLSLDECKRDLEASRKENELLKEQLAGKDALIATKDALIAAKEEMLNFLRGGYNRPN